MPTTRDFSIHRDRSRLKGSVYIEIGPGRYSGQRWREGYILVREDSFAVIEGIVKKHFRKYDRRDINNISRTKSMQIIGSLREAAAGVLSCNNDDILGLIEYEADRSPKTVNEFVRNRARIAKLLADLADYMEGTFENHDWICVLGA
jgi:hypothetical protein